ncbi:DUF952 domain-containing protein [Gordonia sp. SID5947]|uniref:DUF952 domain-containing protein n=1 Tax=Gordonia sp. SID5947 TaxID=2690315 RepID=UPI00136E1A5B|nr:DUF952 domain-containing protein [Gordonia sp. SID5947]MYR05800.1 DUF952 domain-containing protein [Gordonia sp. SID5947]
MSDESAGVLLHLCTHGEWAEARRSGFRNPSSVADDGFIHLSTPDQVHLPANRLFAGRDDVVLLVIDADRLSAPVVWEPGAPDDPESMRFPHLYGALPTDVVVEARPYTPNADGAFAPPAL